MILGTIYCEGITIGATQNHNEDSILLDSPLISDETQQHYLCSDRQMIDDHIYVYGVADGVGSAFNSDFTSKYVLRKIGEWKKTFNGGNQHIELDEMKCIIEDLIRDCNQEVSRMGSKHSPMATTVAIVFLYNGCFFSVSVGDSLIYLIRKGTVSLLASNHTLASMKRERGLRTQSRDKETLIHYIGEDRIDDAINVITGPFDAGDVFLILSDGCKHYKDRLIELVDCYSVDSNILNYIFDDNKKNDDDCSAVRISISMDTGFIQNIVESSETDTDFINIVERAGVIESWNQIISRYIDGKKGIISKVAKDWNVDEKTVKRWLNGTVQIDIRRDNLIRLCISLGLSMREINHLLVHHALFSKLSESDAEDLVWIHLINDQSQSEHNPLYEQYQALRKATDNTNGASNSDINEDSIINSILSALIDEGYNINNIWDEQTKESRNKGKKIYSYLQTREQTKKLKGDIIPRVVLVSLALKSQRTLSDLNDWLIVAGKEPLRCRNVFEASLIYILSSLELTQDSLFYEEKNLRREAVQDLELVDVVIEKLKNIEERLDFEYRKEYSARLSQLIKYI